MAKDVLKGSKALPVVGVEKFEELKAKELTVFNDAKVLDFSIIDYIDKKTSVPRKIALIDCEIAGAFVTSGVTSMSNVEFMMNLDSWDVKLQYTGTRFNEYTKEDQPTFDVRIRTNA